MTKLEKSTRFEQLEQLRDLLYGEKSKEVFLQICKLCNDSNTDQELIINYAAENLDKWPDEYRCLEIRNKSNVNNPSLRLVKVLNINPNLIPCSKLTVKELWSRGPQFNNQNDKYTTSYEIIMAIADCKHLSDLTHLNLTRCDIRNSGAIALAAIENLSNLKQLDLSENGIGTTGAIAIANSKNLSSLRNLNLGANGIGTTGAIAIANSKNLSSLRNLNLAVNRINNEGAIALAAIENLSKLTDLCLYFNEIESSGARALAQSKYLSYEVKSSLKDQFIISHKIFEELVKKPISTEDIQNNTQQEISEISSID